MKKILLTLLAFVLFIPFALAEGEEVVSYQKLKNVTKKDHPAGSNLTMGFSGDEIRFLIFVQNKTEKQEIFRIEDILPKGLLYQANTTYRYQLGSGGDWMKVEENKTFPLADYLIKIDAGEGFYFKFSTIVAEDIPANNLTLSNFVKVYGSANKVLKQTVTKVLVPNSTVKQVETNVLGEENEEEYVNRVLLEEQDFIEKTFFELEERGFEGELLKTENLKLKKDSEENKDIVVAKKMQMHWGWGVGVVLVLVLLVMVKRKNKF